MPIRGEIRGSAFFVGGPMDGKETAVLTEAVESASSQVAGLLAAHPEKWEKAATVHRGRRRRKAEIAKEFIDHPDGMFFILDSSGLALPLGTEKEFLPEGTEIDVPLDGQITVDDTYAVVVFTDRGPIAKTFRAESIFRARAQAQIMAAEFGQRVSLARVVGKLPGGELLFQGMEFIDFVSEVGKQKPTKTEIQTLIFDKKRFPTAADAKRWARENDFKAGGVDETENSFRLRQRDPGDFQPGSFRTISLTEGVKAVIGRPKKEKGTLSATEEDLVQVLQEVEESFRVSSETDRFALARGGISGLGAGVGAALSALEVVRKETEVGTARFEAIAAIVRKDEMRQIVYGTVYKPREEDAHGDFMSEAEVEEMAHKFLMRYRHDPTSGVDQQHDSVVRNVDVVESFIARKGDPDFPEGAWVMAVKIHDKALWEQILNGEITGFSFAGVARNVVDHPETA